VVGGEEKMGRETDWFYRLSIKQRTPSHTTRALTFPIRLAGARPPWQKTQKATDKNDVQATTVGFVFHGFVSYSACFVCPMFFLSVVRLHPLVWDRGLLHPGPCSHTQTPATIESPQIC
jgi:hypothetical protein